MLIRLGQNQNTDRPSPDAVVRIADADYPKVFPWRLEYNCPVHENWNIVHTGMLIPECRQIYVCSDNCLRGVIMTADEMDAASRISSVMPTEREVVGGRLEEVTVRGITDILERLPEKPRAVQVFLVCMHHFLGADARYIFRKLENRFPDIDFMPCWMDPIMQKVGLTPEQKQRRSMMEVIPKLAEPAELQERPDQNPPGQCADCPAEALKPGRFAADLGDNLRLPESSDISRLLAACGIRLKQVMDCTSYDQYLGMGDSFLYLTRSALSNYGLKALGRKHGRPALYLPPAAMDSQIGEELRKLLGQIKASQNNSFCLEKFLEEEKKKTQEALAKARNLIGDTEIWLDYIAFPRPLSFARRLLLEGFRVTRVLMDSVSPEEEEDFRYLQKTHPSLEIQSTSHVEAREKRLIRQDDLADRQEAAGLQEPASRQKLPGQEERTGKILALGPKAAFFADTPYFVNWIENDGNWGFDGLRRLASAMIDAYRKPKDTRDLVQRKGLGLPSVVEKGGGA